MMPFKNRADAGQQLTKLLQHYDLKANVLVLALPRGGVPVAYEVATQLHLPLDVFLVRKLGYPGQEELAMGAIASGGIRVLNEGVLQSRDVTQQLIEEVTAREDRELQRREQLYREGRPAYQVAGQTIILIDDGLATGATMRAAAQALRQQQPQWLVVAVPVAAERVCQEFRQEVDEMICAMTPRPFYGVGMWYEDFSQTTDEEVQQLLEQATL